jgi:hypothetical protein
MQWDLQYKFPLNSSTLIMLTCFVDPGTNGENTETKYIGTIMDRFPETDYPQNPLPPHIWMFCFPEGVKPAFSAPNPTYSVNVLTQIDGTRSYIASLTFYEAVHTSLKANVKNLSDKLKKKLSGTTLNSESPPPPFALRLERSHNVYQSKEDKPTCSDKVTRKFPEEISLSLCHFVTARWFGWHTRQFDL